MAEAIYLTTEKGEKIRILTPGEYDRIIDVIDKDYLRTLFNVCFFTGMRYIEVQRLHQHPEYWKRDRQVIYLDREAQRKVKRTTPERWVPIPPQLQGEIAYFFRNKTPPSRKVWGEDLKRWAIAAEIGAEGIVPKMTRATIETWMYIAGLPPHEICLRQGHDKLTSINHYQALAQAFMASEVHEIKKRLAGWHT